MLLAIGLQQAQLPTPFDFVMFGHLVLPKVSLFTLMLLPFQLMSLSNAVVEDVEWNQVYTTAWNSLEAIHMLEGRSTRQALCHAARTPSMIGHRLLILCDNMSCVCAFDKSRCKTLPLLRPCRRNAAMSLSSGLHPRWRYIESKRNPADAETRPDLLPKPSDKLEAGSIGVSHPSLREQRHTTIKGSSNERARHR